MTVTLRDVPGIAAFCTRDGETSKNGPQQLEEHSCSNRDLHEFIRVPWKLLGCQQSHPNGNTGLRHQGEARPPAS